MAMQKLFITWHGPYSIKAEQGRYVYKSKYARESWGLYTVTRKFGEAETLLYIGETYKECRNFDTRISEHEKEWFCKYRGQIQIRLGEVTNKQRRAIDVAESKLKAAEALQIRWHRPLRNIQHKTSYCDIDLTVVNKDRRGLLCPVISTDAL